MHYSAFKEEIRSYTTYYEIAKRKIEELSSCIDSKELEIESLKTQDRTKTNEIVFLKEDITRFEKIRKEYINVSEKNHNELEYKIDNLEKILEAKNK